MSEKHTPTQWERRGLNVYAGERPDISGHICTCSTDAHAEQVVREHNSHAVLLAACEAVDRIVDQLPNTLSDVAPIIKAAIAKASPPPPDPAAIVGAAISEAFTRKVGK